MRVVEIHFVVSTRHQDISGVFEEENKILICSQTVFYTEIKGKLVGMRTQQRSHRQAIMIIVSPYVGG